ncbi:MULTISPECIES: TRAP transporter small permease [Halomonas]|uniref:TRAP transporter small permease n=1 Tax=Halomonas TaxID=2745 RepID=UPI001A8FF1A2|nr:MULTISPECIES: TRAP transporter small permease [Halomonas]MBN8412978.1 TRAP transporter small permease [Halomonas litopenaei]MBY5925294.1 TRAP transporter small permease [Halomonas sp. DP4Y7-2]MBY5929108.1 TRAP transporter small permease [Halomonas sp. DP8Y7-3]MBY5968201.1 TRAP transporter small permease [Halomonas denitrificans]MBY5983694.1 TRAP transporter small permease [Halomonas sp. DP5Y7-2]
MSWSLAQSRPVMALRRLSLWSASALLLIDLLAMLYGVAARYLAGGAPIWTDELARYLIIGAVMLALGSVWIEGGHMRVALIERLIPRTLGRILSVYQWLLTLALAAGGAWFSFHYAQSVAMFQSQGLGISRAVPVMSVPLGFALLTLMALCHGPFPLPTQDGDADAAQHDRGATS